MSFTPIAERDLCFLDTETTGLNPTHHEVIDIAVIRCDPKSMEPRFEWTTKIQPEHLDRAHPRVLKTNGFTKVAWEGAPDFTDVAEEIWDRLEGSVLVGHNVSFDEAMVNAAFRRARLNYKLPYHKVDTVTLAYVHLAKRGLESVNLDNIRRFLGISEENSHTALKDVRDTRDIYILLARPDIRARNLVV